jgi:exo-1,4-beta-D-glucosaminidase
VVDLEENKSVRIYKLPSLYGTVFLSLSLLDERNAVIADNFYWLSGKPDVYDWEKTEWFYTPLKFSADFRQMNYLTSAELEVSRKNFRHGDSWSLETTITNKSKRVAFVNIALKDSSNHTLFPVFWDDNSLASSR